MSLSPLLLSLWFSHHHRQESRRHCCLNLNINCQRVTNFLCWSHLGESKSNPNWFSYLKHLLLDSPKVMKVFLQNFRCLLQCDVDNLHYRYEVRMFLPYDPNQCFNFRVGCWSWKEGIFTLLMFEHMGRMLIFLGNRSYITTSFSLNSNHITTSF